MREKEGERERKEKTLTPMREKERLWVNVCVLVRGQWVCVSLNVT